MAQGQLRLFNETSLSFTDGRLDLGNDDFKFALVSVIPSVTDPVPCWGAGGSTNLSSNEVSGGTSYVAGGHALSNVTWTRAANICTFGADDLARWELDGSGPTDIKAGVLYDDTAANKDCIGFIDMTVDGVTAISLQDTPIQIAWNASGIFRHTVNLT